MSAHAWIVLCLICVADICVSGQYLKNAPTNPLLIDIGAYSADKATDNPLAYLPPTDITAEGDNPLQTEVLLKASETEEDGKYHEDEDHTHWDIRKSVPGEPGLDYPVYDSIPETSFTCEKKLEGYYADIEAGCQVFHICSSMPVVKKSFLCPNGSIFNQELSICDWWTQVNCKESENLFQQSKIGVNSKNNEIVRKKPAKLSPTVSKTQDDRNSDNRFVSGESTKLNINLLPPYDALKTPSVTQNSQPFVTNKSSKTINLSFPPSDNQILNTFESRVNQQYSPQQSDSAFDTPSRFYLGSIASSTSVPDYRSAETYQKSNSFVTTPIYTPVQYIPPENIQANSELRTNTYIPPENDQESSQFRGNAYVPPENVQENSEPRVNTYIPPENLQENSELRGNMYIPPENVQENSELKVNTYIAPENVQENSELKGNMYIPPENVQENSELRVNTYIAPENVQENSELRGNTYIPPENVQENSELRGNMYIPPENVKENSEPIENTFIPTGKVQENSEPLINSYLPPKNVQEDSKLQKNTYIPPVSMLENSESLKEPVVSSENILQYSASQQNSNILPKNDPQESIKLLKQFSSIYDSQREGKTKSTSKNNYFPSTLNHLLSGRPTTPLISLSSSTDAPVIFSTTTTKSPSYSLGFSSTTYSQPKSTTEGFKLINIHAVNRAEFSESSPYYQSTLSVPYTVDGNYVTPTSLITEGPSESHSTTINLINELTAPEVNRLTPKLTFSENVDKKKELKISLVRDNLDSSNNNNYPPDPFIANSNNISASTENTPKVSTTLDFSQLRGFSTPRPFDNNENILPSNLPQNSETQKVNFKPLDIININNLQPSTLSPKSPSGGLELVQSISFNLDSEEGRKQFDLAVSSGLFSES